MRPVLAALLAGAALLTLPSATAAARVPDLAPAEARAPAIAPDDIVEVLACGPNCRQNRRVSRRTSRRVSRRHDAYHGGGYYGRPGVVVVDDGPNAAAIGLAAGVAGMAVGAAISSSANNTPPPAGNYPY